LLYGRQARGLDLEREAAQTLAVLLSCVTPHRAKSKCNKVNRYKFDVIVNASILANQ